MSPLSSALLDLKLLSRGIMGVLRLYGVNAFTVWLLLSFSLLTSPDSALGGFIATGSRRLGSSSPSYLLHLYVFGEKHLHFLSAGSLSDSFCHDLKSESTLNISNTFNLIIDVKSLILRDFLSVFDIAPQ